MPLKIITISLPKELLHKLDVAAEEEYATRSEFIRQAIIERLRFIDKCRMELSAAAFNTDAPAEEKILALLRQRSLGRSLKKMLKKKS